jgi:hypothetical protein
MNIYDFILGGFFTLWFLISSCSQFKVKWVSKLRTLDILHLIPNWRFFAPMPARKDYHLEYRIKTKELGTSKWRQIQLTSERSLWCVVWYPQKRLRKSFNTSVRRITRMLFEKGYESTARSIAYLHLLNYLQNRSPAKKANSLQFRIISQQDFADDCKSRLVFTSDWHIQQK